MKLVFTTLLLTYISTNTLAAGSFTETLPGFYKVDIATCKIGDASLQLTGDASIENTGSVLRLNLGVIIGQMKTTIPTDFTLGNGTETKTFKDDILRLKTKVTTTWKTDEANRIITFSTVEKSISSNTKESNSLQQISDRKVIYKIRAKDINAECVLNR